ncbi:MAG: calpastatin [Mycobacterium sp.]|nr:calpastatin [Mycobacterium sp.]
MTDPFHLQRFVDAQAGVYDTVVTELRNGRKRSHWIWFIFPQLAGLGHSATAERYAISSPAEADEYLRHDLLGPRLRECTRLVNAVEGRSIEEIFGWPDYLKVRSSMTLFARVTADDEDFLALLDKYYGGEQDSVTLTRLSAGPKH